MLIEIIPGSKSYKSNTFTYGVPENLQTAVKTGSIVYIPFGKKKIRGVVKKIINNKTTAQKSDDFVIKDISSVDPVFTIPANYHKAAEWLCDRYFCTLGEALSLFLPTEMKRPPKLLSREISSIDHVNLKKLSSEQKSIYSEIKKAGAEKPHLVYGVTGSGKTEIYLHLAVDAIAAGKSVVVLVPEIILTPQTIDRFREIFGDEIALVHSNLATGEKYQAYRDFSQGHKKIIVGPRSALLIPNDNIGLIIVDEEHEEAYKQDNSPRYHAVDLAEMIAKTSNAILVLGSATPRIESYFKARSDQYMLHQIKSRYNKLLLPPSEIIDLRNELRSGNFSLISEKLSKAIRNIINKKKQAILFLNRRGASTFVSCRECGFVIKCPNCDIPLVHHSRFSSSGASILSQPFAGINRNNAPSTGCLYCHHCDYKTELPSICPDCHGVKIKYFGAGVEKVESEVTSLFPDAKVRRIDATTIKNKGDYETFYRDFKTRKFDIAIGTQMITKGLDLPHVDLVGIISADTGLHMPYFRASEKVFRLVTQVSGRSGRAEHPGQTIIQTYWPDSAAINFASNHDFEGFYNAEIKKRELHHYPPFCDLIRIVSEHEKPDKAKNELIDLGFQLDKLLEKYPASFEYIGPGLCFFQRIRNKWRYHILIKLHNNFINDEIRISNVETDEMSTLLKDLRELWKDNLNLIWDMDPFDLL